MYECITDRRRSVVIHKCPYTQKHKNRPPFSGLFSRRIILTIAA